MDRRSFLRNTSWMVVSTAAGAQFLAGCAPTSTPASSGAGTSSSDAPDSSEGAPSAEESTTRVFQAPSGWTLLQTFVLLAEQRGYFADEGLTVELVPGTGTADAVTQVASGGAFMGIADPLTLAPAIADEGADLLSIAEIAPGVFWEVASSPVDPLRHPRDWQGKTIGIASVGGATEQFLDAAAISEGLDPNNVEKVVTGLDAGSYAFLEQGQVAGFISYYASKAALQLQPDVQLNYLNLGDFVPVPSSSFMVSRSALDDPASRDAAVRWLRATREAFRYSWDEANIEDAIDVLAEYSPATVEDRELARATWEVTKTYMSPTDGDTFYMDPERWDAAHELIFDAGFTENTELPPSNFYSNELLEELD